MGFSVYKIIINLDVFVASIIYGYNDSICRVLRVHASPGQVDQLVKAHPNMPRW